MKRKYIVLSAIVIVSVIVLSSCKSTHQCPAYSKAEVEHSQKNV